jgi:transposase
MRFVAVKSEEQQAAGLLFRTRDLLVRQRTQLINAIRGVARHGKVPPRRHEELPPLWIAEERANERGTNHGRLVVE